ncbi:alpha-N-acetylglucosaminidase TIM-barrel domain-containing protein [Humibacter ginsenosidimutans]|nr:alpha-N-acetylglucosaminidase TIM-barrel domain-containing protein [Humibacter ginsenosidimutans]
MSTAALAAGACVLTGTPSQALAAPARPAVVPGKAASIGAGAQPAADTLTSWVGSDAASDFDLSIIPASGAEDVYRVTASNGRVHIEGSTPATILAGFDAYIGQVLHQSVSWNESNLHLPATLPDTALITATSNVQHRFVNNDVEDGYTGPYRTFDDWKKLIDVYAMHGLNEVFMPVGSEAVYYDVFKQYGYTQAQLLSWIPQAAHQPWWLLQNMSGAPDALTMAQVDARADLGKKIADYLRSLGMVPVLPGYFGTVPSGFASHASDTDPSASVNIVPQGTWAGGYARPDWLDPNSGVFPDLAAKFYAASQKRLGASTMYKADVLHEGGTAGNVDVPSASKAIQNAMLKAHDDSIWVLLGWQSNPPAAVISAADPKHTFIVDGLSDRYDGLDRESSWKGVPYAFGTIWNFGGHTTIGANLGVQNTRYFDWLNKSGSAMKGLAVLPEGGENNPAEFDFFTGLAWRSGPVDLDTWFADYAHRRYGVDDADAAAAWKIIGETAYSLPSDGWSEAADSIFGAVPSLTVGTAAAWSPSQQRYDTAAFEKALPLLLKASAAVEATPTFKYDLMDVARQVVDNLDRPLLAKIKKAYDSGQQEDFATLTKAWLGDMDLVDQLAGTDQQQLLGSWLETARDAASTSTEADVQERDARAIITTWTPANGSLTDLNDYANREWNGLVGGYYKARWAAYFDYLSKQLAGTPVAAPNFGTMGKAFVDGTASYEPTDGYATKQTGDILSLSTKAVDSYAFATGFEPTPQPLPAPPGAGVTQLSEIGFVSDENNSAYGPTARNTEIGDAATHVRNAITLGGTTYATGIGVNSPSTIVFNLDGRCTRFDSFAGIDASMDLPGKTPNVVFSVSGDGKTLYTSDPFIGGGSTPAQPLKIGVDVTGVKLLTLHVDPNGSEYFDRADWADAKVTCDGPDPVPAPPGDGITQLSHLPFLSDDHDAQYGPIARDTAIGDTGTHVTPPITIGGVVYPTGLGVQAETSIQFNLDKRCTTFSAWVGIDATMDVSGKTPSVTFSVDGDGKTLYTSKELTGGAAVHAVADVTGVKTLTLKADPGTINWFDRADWGDAKVTCTDPTAVAPTTHATLSAAAPASGWYRTAPTVTLSADDAAKTEYRLGAGDWTTYTAPVTMPEGQTVLSYRSTGTNGKVEEAQSLDTVKVDSTAPIVQAKAEGRTVTITASDDGSGIASVEYSTDGGSTWKSYTAPVEAGKDALTVSYRATDVAGNPSTAHDPVTVPADTSEPGSKLTIALGGGADAKHLRAGQKVSVVVTGATEGAALELALHSTPVVVAHGTADANGGAVLDAVIPSGTKPGAHTLVLTASVQGDDAATASLDITVVATGGTTPTPGGSDGATPPASGSANGDGDLAATGSSIPVELIAGAVVLLFVGAGTVLSSVLRRRRASR